MDEKIKAQKKLKAQWHAFDKQQNLHLNQDTLILDLSFLAKTWFIIYSKMNKGISVNIKAESSDGASSQTSHI